MLLCHWNTCMWCLEGATLSGIRAGIRFPRDDKALCIHDISYISLRNMYWICVAYLGMDKYQVPRVDPEELFE